MQFDCIEWGALESLSIAPVRLAHQAHLLPRVVRIAGLSIERRLQLLDQNEMALAMGERELWSCALQTTVSLEEIAAHLAGNLVLTTPHGQHFLLRFFDPRVFRHLIWILKPGQLASLMGPVVTWSWMDIEGDGWQSAEPAEAPSAARLTPEQWGAINRIGLTNAVLRDVKRARMDVAFNEELYRRVDSVLKGAIEVEGLKDAGDQRLYAFHCVQRGNQWQNDRAVKSLLGQVRKGAGSYRALSSEFAPAGVDQTPQEREGNQHA